MDTIPDLTIGSNPPRSQSALPRAIGDLNGDGYSDFITATNMAPSIAYIYWGGNPPDTNPSVIWNNFYVGWPPAIIDINGNGFGDLLVSRTNRIDVHLGGPAISSIPDFALQFPNCEYGPQEVDYAGDYNGDGICDVAVVSPDCNSALGAVKLYLGCHWSNSYPSLSIDGGSAPLNLVGILHAVGIGDVNGDGIEDLAIGATNQMTFGQGRRGRVVILSGDTTLRVDATEQLSPIPQEFAVQVCPNPFNARTEIRFLLPQMSRATLTIYDLAGREVAQIADETFAAGEHAISWNAAGLPSGVYFARLHAGEFTATRKLLLLR